MKNRFFVAGDLAAGAVLPLTDDERHHARVLRVREGEDVEVFNGAGFAFSATFDSGGVRLKEAIASRELPVEIHLAMAIIHPEKFELVLQKATELGVASIVPLITERCEVRLERIRGKQERWEKIVFEAVKQSGRSRIPKVEETTTFEEAIARDGSKIVFDAEEPASTTRQPDNPTILFIGPEGGWSDAELRLARDSGCTFRSLGERRLRAETAAIVATAMVVLDRQ